ncbi:DUF4190 domain-containing protein [Pseudonocardia sp. HH130630-07]|uniref:DUF4190 domain-containing protein n=1 Tax=Pseudonocardia sp. HH130630-07 TaxID=1690815 RepID=UPI00081521B5|nr:DUF4190 domain-containing protein [Pseudonocardia sp. HH130630-07]ANY08972.1 hypothetical protein AFB00_24925 [Pseudonocardia sp. HH130630-07]
MSSPPPYPGQSGNPQDPNQQSRPEQPTEQYGQQYGQYAQQPGGYPDRPQYDPQGYPGGYGGHQPPPPAPRNGVGIAALVLGILAVLSFWLVVGGVLGLIAIGLGILGIVRAGKGIASNRGVAITGLILGIVGVLATVAYVVFVTSLFTSLGGGDLVQCIQSSDGSQSAMEQCQRDFEDRLMQESDRLGG